MSHVRSVDACQMATQCCCLAGAGLTHTGKGFLELNVLAAAIQVITQQAAICKADVCSQGKQQPPDTLSSGQSFIVPEVSSFL